MTDPAAARPLSGLRVVEFAGLGPVPFAATILADMGADVVRIDRPGGVVRPGGQANDFTQSSRRAVAIDLSESSGVARALALIERADVVVEGFRPGVVERLGVGPQECRHRNAALVYGRMTGWGQSGPLASRAGHDINYLAVTGALHAIGTAERPTVPLNLVADYGGGAMFLVAGVLAARLRAVATGVGDVVDAAMVDGVIALTGVVQGMRSSGLWADGRESNVVDGGLPWYSVYETADGHWMSVGALEPQFFREFLPPASAGRHRGPPRRSVVLASHARRDRGPVPPIRSRPVVRGLRRDRRLRHARPDPRRGDTQRPPPGARGLRPARRHRAAGPGATLRRQQPGWRASRIDRRHGSGRPRDVAGAGSVRGRPPGVVAVAGPAGRRILANGTDVVPSPAHSPIRPATRPDPADGHPAPRSSTGRLTIGTRLRPATGTASPSSWYPGCPDRRIRPGTA